MPVAKDSSQTKPGLLFSYGDCVDWSLLFEVFSFEVCADPFADVGAGGREKFDFFEFVTKSSQNFLYLFEILSVVGCDSDSARGDKAAKKMLEICRGKKTSFVVSFFRPGVGEVDVETFHRIIGDKFD